MLLPLHQFFPKLSPDPRQVNIGGALHFLPARVCSGVWLAPPAWVAQGPSQTLANSSLSPQGAEADRPDGVPPHRDLRLPGTCTQGTC